MPRKAPDSSQTANETPNVTPAQRSKLLARIAAFYHRAITDAADMAQTVIKRLGLPDTPLLKSFQIGFGDGKLLEVLPQDAGTQAQLKALGILGEDGAETLKDCIVFPLWNMAGVIINLLGVRLADGATVTLPGELSGLWNYQAARRSDALLLAGSIPDALAAISNDFPDTLALLANQLTGDHLRLMAECQVRRVVLALPGNAPELATIRQQLSDAGLSVAVLALPNGQGINAYLSGLHADNAKTALSVKVGEAFASLNSGAVGVDSTVAVAGELYEATNYGFKLTLHGRSYEVKGIARETTQLKTTIKAIGDRAKGFELTTLDLYSARSRDAYCRACVALFDVAESFVKADLLRLLERAETWQPVSKEADTPPPPSTETLAAAEAFLRDPALFEHILADLATLGVAGEETNKLLCYLAAVSRKLDDPLSLLIQSRSAAGKSTLQHAVLALTPSDEQVHYTRLTGQSLFYQGETQLAHKVLALEEAEGLGEAAYSLRALQSSKKLSIATTARNPLTGKPQTEHYQVQGPVAVLLTTTSAALDEETASRFLTLTIDESQAMTETILASQRHRDTLAGYMAELDRAAVIDKHHAAQRLLEPLVVINPYAEHLRFPAHSLRARRDHKKYLQLIKVVAFLYQKQRPILTAQRGGSTFRYIEATPDDIAHANRLAVQALGHSLDELSAPARNLLKQVHAMVTAYCTEHDVPASDYIFTRKDVRDYTGWSDWQIRTHSTELVRLEYLKARTGQWGKEFVYELAWDGQLPGGHVLALAQPEQLQKELTV